MAKDSFERARWKRKEARRRLRIGGFWCGFCVTPSLKLNKTGMNDNSRFNET
ncbi:MAG: hypothetical protein JWQ08_1955 [Deinococcus sp.]|nr:hypothetical protein [Deinococcus sp.]